VEGYELIQEEEKENMYDLKKVCKQVCENSSIYCDHMDLKEAETKTNVSTKPTNRADSLMDFSFKDLKRAKPEDLSVSVSKGFNSDLLKSEDQMNTELSNLVDNFDFIEKRVYKKIMANDYFDKHAKDNYGNCNGIKMDINASVFSQDSMNEEEFKIKLKHSTFSQNNFNLLSGSNLDNVDIELEFSKSTPSDKEMSIFLPENLAPNDDINPSPTNKALESNWLFSLNSSLIDENHI